MICTSRARRSGMTCRSSTSCIGAVAVATASSAAAPAAQHALEGRLSSPSSPTSSAGCDALLGQPALATAQAPASPRRDDLPPSARFRAQRVAHRRSTLVERIGGRRTDAPDQDRADVVLLGVDAARALDDAQAVEHVGVAREVEDARRSADVLQQQPPARVLVLVEVALVLKARPRRRVARGELLDAQVGRAHDPSIFATSAPAGARSAELGRAAPARRAAGIEDRGVLLAELRAEELGRGAVAQPLGQLARARGFRSAESHAA